LRGLQFFTSPVDGVLEARYASNMFRNDGEVSFLSDWFRRYKPNEPEFFTTVIFENPAHVSLSWHMTRGEVEELKKGMGRLRSEITPAAEPGPELASAKQDASVQNARRLQRLSQWWAR